MLTPVVLPQLGLEVSEGTVQALLASVGDRVEEGAVLAEVETDKAITDIVATRDGWVVSIEVQVGTTVPVGTTLFTIGDAMADSSSACAHEQSGAASSNDSADGLAPAGSQDSEPAEARRAGTARRPGARILAAPVARRAAAELNVSLEDVAGTGPNGRIVLADVQGAAAAREAPPDEPQPEPEPGPYSASPAGDVEPLSPLRRVIARRMTASQLVPQFTLHRDVAFKWLLAEKDRIADAGVNDLLVHALADTVASFPQLAMQFVDGDPPALRRAKPDDVGLAIATPRGLIVGVVRNVQQLRLAEIAGERRRLIKAGHDGRLAPNETEGSTVTVSSLAGFGIDRFNAMLNPPEAAILAVGRTTDRLFSGAQGLVFGPMAELSMTFDHRVVDGAIGAAALTHLAELLEGRASWRE